MCQLVLADICWQKCLVCFDNIVAFVDAFSTTWFNLQAVLVQLLYFATFHVTRQVDSSNLYTPVVPSHTNNFYIMYTTVRRFELMYRSHINFSHT